MEDSPAPSTPYDAAATPRSNREPSPVGDFENEAELLEEDEIEAESEGEDLFGDAMER